jgi:putative transposase
MGDTLPLKVEGRCLGRSVTSWTSDSGLSPACSRAKRWRRCAPSSEFPEKTGYKVFDRYQDCGVQAFSDRSHRAHRQANRLPAPIEATIVRLKREYPGWGAPKIREKLRQQFTGPHLPAISTVHAVLDRYSLVHHRRRRRPRATGTALSRPTQPNALWCADYKGEFLLGNRRYCYPSRSPTSRVATC